MNPANRGAQNDPMTGTVITVTSGKGGSRQNDHHCESVLWPWQPWASVLLAIDADIGLRNLDLVMGLENRIMFDSIDVAEGAALLQQAHGARISGPSFFMCCPQPRRGTSRDLQPSTRCKPFVRKTSERGRFCPFDSPAGIEQGFQTAIAPADRVLIVTTSDVSALRDADKVIYLLERDRHKPPGLVINRFNERLVRARAKCGGSTILDILAIDLMGVVPEYEHLMLTTDLGHQRSSINAWPCAGPT